MNQRSSLLPLSLALLAATACQATKAAPCPDTQALVEATARGNPDILRLTVHKVPANASTCIAVASTSPAKLGQPSDPEDLQAMSTGQTIVLDEPGALDVTVPVLPRDGRYTAAVGVTLKAGAAADRIRLVARAKEIAMSVETQLAAHPR